MTRSHTDSPRRAGVAIFEWLRRRANGGTAFLYAFDLIELNGADLRREPIENRKTELAKLAHNAKPGLQLSVHLDRPGDVVFEHACKLGLEGIVSKRRGSRYESGRWIKTKNPNHLSRPAPSRGMLGVGYVLPDGKRTAHPIKADDWPIIARLEREGQLTYSSDAVRERAEQERP